MSNTHSGKGNNQKSHKSGTAAANTGGIHDHDRKQHREKTDTGNTVTDIAGQRRQQQNESRIKTPSAKSIWAQISSDSDFFTDTEPTDAQDGKDPILSIPRHHMYAIWALVTIALIPFHLLVLSEVSLKYEYDNCKMLVR